MIDFTRCAYHAQHETRQVERRLSDHKLLDVPQVRPDLDRTLDLTIYAWEEYSDDTFSRYDFCPGQDAVSYCIDRQGIWEGYESLAVLDIMSRGRGMVVDVGSHIGWYGAIAASSGCDVRAVEANPGSLEMTIKNIDRNARSRGAGHDEFRNAMVGDIEPLPAEPIRLFISDVEGSEVQAVEYCRASFTDRLVDFAMLEMSPVFNDSYPQLTADFNSWGYQGFQIPHKGEHLIAYGLDPLGVLLAQRPVTPEVVAGWRQESCLFVAPDVFTLLT